MANGKSKSRLARAKVIWQRLQEERKASGFAQIPFDQWLTERNLEIIRRGLVKND